MSIVVTMPINKVMGRSHLCGLWPVIGRTDRLDG